MNIFIKITKQREFMIFSIVLGVIVIMSFASPYFFNSANLIAVMLGLSVEAIIVVGMTSLMVSGGFDMSVGSIVGFTSVSCAMMMKAGVPVLFAFIIGIAIGMGIGLFNGVIIAKVGINPFVTTLASLNIFRGLTLAITSGKNISGLPEAFKFIGQGSLFGIQMPIWYAVILIIIGDILLRRTRFFRQNYYIGGNEKAAMLSGIAVKRMKILNYVIIGGLAAAAGIVMTARLGAASVSAGTGIELRVITAAIVGGASLNGGEGTIIGAFLGTVLMALITNALTLLGIDIYWQTFVIGITLLAAVLIDRYGKIRKEKSEVFQKAVKKGLNKTTVT
jgi:ribose transport system permease protein